MKNKFFKNRRSELKWIRIKFYMVISLKFHSDFKWMCNLFFERKLSSTKLYYSLNIFCFSLAFYQTLDKNSPKNRKKRDF